MRIQRALFALAVVGLGSGSAAAQSDVAFPPDVYLARRARLLAQAGDAVVIVPGRYLIGAHDLPKPDPSFWYLTGVESPYAVLVMTRARTALFLPEKYQFAGAQYPMLDEGFRKAVWNRPPRRLAPGEEASHATGIAENEDIQSATARSVSAYAISAITSASRRPRAATTRARWSRAGSSRWSRSSTYRRSRSGS